MSDWWYGFWIGTLTGFAAATAGYIVADMIGRSMF